MNEEARPSGDRSRHRAPRRRSRWARRTPYGIRRDGGFRDELRAPLDPHDDATYAALDLGTNNCRLLIARPTARRLSRRRRVLPHHPPRRRRCRFAADQRGGDCARGRGAAGLPRQDARARRHARAAHRHRGLPRGRERRGVPRPRRRRGRRSNSKSSIRATEARLAAAGCTRAVRSGRSAASSCSISAAALPSWCGSAGRTGAAADRRWPSIVGWASLPVGVVTLAERYGGTAVPRDVYDAMVDEVAASVEKFAVAHRGDLADFHMLGTSGTVTTIAGVYLRLKRYDRRRVDGCWLSDGEVSRVVGRAHGHELRRACGQSLHRRRARRPGARRLRHPRRHPPRLSLRTPARCRSRPARGHARRDDARRRRVGPGLTGHGAP